MTPHAQPIIPFVGPCVERGSGLIKSAAAITRTDRRRPLAAAHPLRDPMDFAATMNDANGAHTRVCGPAA